MRPGPYQLDDLSQLGAYISRIEEYQREVFQVREHGQKSIDVFHQNLHAGRQILSPHFLAVDSYLPRNFLVPWPLQYAEKMADGFKIGA